MTSSLSTVFSAEKTARLAGQRVFRRGLTINPSYIENLEVTDQRASATVRGTLPYVTSLWMTDKNRPIFSCTCPQGDEGKFCKHCVALAIFLGDKKEDGERQHFASDTSAQQNDSDTPDFLQSLDHDELVKLVMDAATRDEATAMRISSRRSIGESSLRVDVKEWRRMIDRAFGSRSRFIDYRAAPEWASGVFAAIESLEQLVDDGGARDALELLERAFERNNRAVEHVDDSDGWITDISLAIASAHLRACELSRPDPKQLARRLVKFELDFELDTFRGAAQPYAELLGLEGLAEYRLALGKVETQLTPPDDDYRTMAFRLRYARIGIALGSNDPDELISIFSSERMSPRSCLEIADALLRVGRDEEALDWAQRGLELPNFSEHFRRDLRVRLVTLLQSRGDTTAAREVLFEGFCAAPSPDSMRALLAGYDEVDRTVIRDKAVAWLFARTAQSPSKASGSELVRALLFEGEVERAFEAAHQFDCSTELKLRIARAIESSRPADAIALYGPEIENLIAKKNRQGYQSAMALLARQHHLYLDAADPADWNQALEQITATHRAKTSLMSMLRERGWLSPKSQSMN